MWILKKTLIHQKVEDFSSPKWYITLLYLGSLWFLSGIYLTSYNHKTTLLKYESNRPKFQNISCLIFAYCYNKHITKVSDMVWQLKISLIFKFETNQNSSFSGNFQMLQIARSSNFCVTEMLWTFLKRGSSVLFENCINFHFQSLLF